MNGEDINTMYPITNRFWQYIDDMSLYEYLVSLGVNMHLELRGVVNKNDPPRFYLRAGIYDLNYQYRNSLQNVSMIKQLMDKDPWHRTFNAFPTYDSLVNYKYPDHEYYGCEAKWLSSYMDGECNCYVMVTTVCGERVFCVDVLN